MVKVSVGRKAKGAARIRRHCRYVSDVSKAPCAMSSGTKCGRLGYEARKEGVVTGRVRSLYRDLSRLCAGRESRKYRYKGSRQR